MKQKNKIILISIIILIGILLLASVFAMQKSGLIEKIGQVFQKEEIKKEIRYKIYSCVNGKIKMLIEVEDSENGIEKVQYPNREMEIQCYGKNKVGIDYEIDVTEDKNYTFLATNTLGETIEKTIIVNDDYRNGLKDLIKTEMIKKNHSQIVFTANFDETKVTKQYKIGNTENWTNYTGKLLIDGYQIQHEVGLTDGVAQITLREVDSLGYEIQTVHDVDFSGLTYNKENRVIEGESILACIENNNLESGDYIFRVTGSTDGQNSQTIDYPVELYNYNEDMNYDMNYNTVIGNTLYTGPGNSSADKKMLILKYNNNLTISNGVTFTPTGTKETINGVTGLCTKKGMTVYCAGTLQNNGTISMTARGTVNQAGENVYLYKNEDNSYEYVPAVGGAGGTAVSRGGRNDGTTAGNNGANGTVRGTGGGGSGSAGLANHAIGTVTSGAGTAGTSYSGGTGGGGSYTTSVGRAASAGGTNGGAGGAARTQVQSGNTGYAGGGAGNPGGNGSQNNNSTSSYKGTTGTGGLLVIYANNIVNTAIISSNGSLGGNRNVAGGSSGGGSINIFYKENYQNSGTVTTTSGRVGSGGAGGNGSITVGSIATGSFVSD